MRVKTLLFLLTLLTALSSIAHSEEFSPPRLLRVSLLEGDVTYQRPDLDKWVDLSINTPILEGDKIWVGREGRAEIEFEDGNFVRLSANTIVEISRLGSPRNSQGVEIRMIQGLGTFDLRSVSGSFAMLKRSALAMRPFTFSKAAFCPAAVRLWRSFSYFRAKKRRNASRASRSSESESAARPSCV